MRMIKLENQNLSQDGLPIKIRLEKLFLGNNLDISEFAETKEMFVAGNNRFYFSTDRTFKHAIVIWILSDDMNSFGRGDTAHAAEEYFQNLLNFWNEIRKFEREHPFQFH